MAMDKLAQREMDLALAEQKVTHFGGLVRDLKRVAPTEVTPPVQAAIFTATAIGGGVVSGVMDETLEEVPADAVLGPAGLVIGTVGLLSKSPNVTAGLLSMGLGFAGPAMHNLARTGARRAIQIMQDDMAAAGDKTATPPAGRRPTI